MNLLNNFIRDKHGNVAIWQAPNLPLVGWLLFMLITHLVNDLQVKGGLEFLSTAFLFTWAYMELACGVSMFRRLLGLIVLANMVLNHFM